MKKYPKFYLYSFGGAVHMQNDLISVIMGTYNEKVDWVEKSVESILNQTYKKIEFIVIVDNPEQLKLIEMLKLS